jgi:hypothetical protein
MSPPTPQWTVEVPSAYKTSSGEVQRASNRFGGIVKYFEMGLLAENVAVGVAQQQVVVVMPDLGKRSCVLVGR